MKLNKNYTFKVYEIKSNETPWLEFPKSLILPSDVIKPLCVECSGFSVDKILWAAKYFSVLGINLLSKVISIIGLVFIILTLNKLIEIENIESQGSYAKHIMNDFDFGITYVATKDGRESSFCVIFKKFSENFFYYGYGNNIPSRCNLSVDSSKKEISIRFSEQYNPSCVSNLVMWNDIKLYKFNK